MLHEALVDDLVLLWSSPPPPGGAGLAAFRRLYADPVRLNGSTVAASELLERARRLHDALADVRVEVLDRFAAPGRLAVVLRSSGRHVGPLPSPLGDVPPTGRRIEALGIDVLTIEDDRIAGIWVVADELGRLAQVGAVQLVG